ncbi:MAG: hypothetical protein RLZZ28_1798 [Bacteroidota bacterium]
MRKVYLLLLMSSALVISSFVADKLYLGDSLDKGTKVTHFYPNPATTYINFTFDNTVDKSYSLQVYNFLGRKMTEQRIADTKLTINLDDNYLRGLYIYQLRDQSGRLVESGKFQVAK